jgi:hypothetical protein
VLDATGELEFNNFLGIKKMELASNRDYTRFLISYIGQGDTNWVYLGVGRNLTIEAPSSGAFEISAKPIHYHAKTQTIQAARDNLTFSFTDEDKENAQPAPPMSVLRGSLIPRPPELAGKLSSDLIAQIGKQQSWRAILIGINDYSAAEGKYSNLNSPRNDVEELARTLKDNYGFGSVTVILDKEATINNIRNRLFDLDEACGPDDNVLVYYAGHGALARNKAGRWICADGRELPNSEIEDFIQRFKARRVLLVSDSCFSGEFVTRSVGPRFGPEPEIQATTVTTSEKIVKTKAPVRQVLTSGQLAPVPDQGTGYCQNHSPFACELLTDLQETPVGAVLGATDIYAYITEAFRKRQVPEDQLPERGSLNGDAGGEFFVVKFK